MNIHTVSTISCSVYSFAVLVRVVVRVVVAAVAPAAAPAPPDVDAI